MASAYGIPSLIPEQIVPDAQYRPLFMQDGKDFQTPLWFYILMEAQTLGDGGGTKLGPLGSRFIGEVLLGAIHWQEISYFKEVTASPTWESKVLQKLGKTGTEVKFLDLVDYSK